MYDRKNITNQEQKNTTKFQYMFKQKKHDNIKKRLKGFCMFGSPFGNLNSNSEEVGSFSRYFGNQSPSKELSNFGASQNFKDILKNQMLPHQSISTKLDANLQRLENNQPLYNENPDQIAKEIFSSIKQILNGVHDIINQMSMGNNMLKPMNNGPHHHTEALHRLLSGAKELFKQHEDPYILENLGELWKTFKDQDTPLFDTIQNFFYSIAFSINIETSYDGEEELITYTEQTQQTLTMIVSNFDDCAEKNDLERALTHINNENDLTNYQNDDDSIISEAEQSYLFGS